MIKNWEKFNESNNSVSYETLSEVIMFRNNSYMSENAELHKRIDHFVDGELDEDIEDGLVPISLEEHRQFKLKIDELIRKINKDSKLSNTLLSLYSEVESKMKGFPKFYELEDLFLDLIDDGWNIGFMIKPNISFEIEIHNDNSELNISYDDYIDLQIKSNNIVKRLESHFNIDCDITDIDYGKQGTKNVGSITFELTTR
jgi:hypothetical protein